MTRKYQGHIYIKTSPFFCIEVNIHIQVLLKIEEIYYFKYYIKSMNIYRKNCKITIWTSMRIN